MDNRILINIITNSKYWFKYGFKTKFEIKNFANSGLVREYRITDQNKFEINNYTYFIIELNQGDGK